MIFRRIKAHVVKEDWFSVGIDFVIVVFGVFIGIQVANWNDQRNAAEKERGYLQEFKEEVEANIQIGQNNIRLMHIVVTSGERALAFLDKKEACESDCWSLLLDFFFASQVMAVQSSNTVLDEMRRLGLPTSSKVKLSINAYYSNGMATANISRDLPDYRKTIRGLIPVAAHHVLWKNCHLTRPTEDFVTDCENSMSDDEVKQILSGFLERPELVEQLSFWIGHNIFALPTLEEQVSFANNVVETINIELENSK